MNTALLALRIIPGLLLMGRGLQQLVPPAYSPPLLHAPVIAERGQASRASASGRRRLRIPPSSNAPSRRT
jgi:hypothetical protein